MPDLHRRGPSHRSRWHSQRAGFNSSFRTLIAQAQGHTLVVGSCGILPIACCVKRGAFASTHARQLRLQCRNRPVTPAGPRALRRRGQAQHPRTRRLVEHLYSVDCRRRVSIAARPARPAPSTRQAAPIRRGHTTMPRPLLPIAATRSPLSRPSPTRLLTTTVGALARAPLPPTPFQTAIRNRRRSAAAPPRRTPLCQVPRYLPSHASPASTALAIRSRILERSADSAKQPRLPCLTSDATQQLRSRGRPQCDQGLSPKRPRTYSPKPLSPAGNTPSGLPLLLSAAEARSPPKLDPDSRSATADAISHRTARTRSRSPIFVRHLQHVRSLSTLTSGNGSTAHSIALRVHRSRVSAISARAVLGNEALAPRHGMMRPGRSDQDGPERRGWPLEDQESDYEASAVWYAKTSDRRAREQWQ